MAGGPSGQQRKRFFNAQIETFNLQIHRSAHSVNPSADAHGDEWVGVEGVGTEHVELKVKKVDNLWELRATLIRLLSDPHITSGPERIDIRMPMGADVPLLAEFKKVPFQPLEKVKMWNFTNLRKPASEVKQKQKAHWGPWMGGTGYAAKSLKRKGKEFNQNLQTLAEKLGQNSGEKIEEVPVGEMIRGGTRAATRLGFNPSVSGTLLQEFIDFLQRVQAQCAAPAQ
ncbi:hypothetical protein HDV00_002443 [Rhizophlyctis rosea]|nr:hypothetical protein HDV00_002443 [Rhizophlyctis rosea]